MDLKANQPLLQPHEQEEFDLENESQGMGISIITQISEAINNLKQLKSLEILESALVIFTSNIKYMFLMILSMIPFFAFMIFFEIKLQQAKLLERFSSLSYGYSYYVFDDNINHVISNSNLYYVLLELGSLYLLFYPLLELISLTIVVKLAAKLYEGEKELTFREAIDEVLEENIRGPFITSLWVHFFSTSTIVGLLWIAVNHFIISVAFKSYGYYSFESIDQTTIISKGFHMVVFMALLYKYLDWSALWNMGIVVSVLEGETGIEALDMAAYIGKHCHRTGFQLMLVFFAYGVVLRLPCLFAGSGVLVTAIVMGLVCLGNLVKWVALVLYFYDCKAETLLKKVDEEVRRDVKAADFC